MSSLLKRIIGPVALGIATLVGGCNSYEKIYDPEPTVQDCTVEREYSRARRHGTRRRYVVLDCGQYGTFTERNRKLYYAVDKGDAVRVSLRTGTEITKDPDGVEIGRERIAYIDSILSPKE